MKFLVLVCLTVLGVASAAEFGFKRRNNAVAKLTYNLPSQPSDGDLPEARFSDGVQQKRQAAPSSPAARPSNGSSRQLPGAAPLQQAFRPIAGTAQAAFARQTPVSSVRPEQPQKAVAQEAPLQPQRANRPSPFIAPSEETFASFKQASEQAAPVRTRQAARLPPTSRTPEFQAGFPEGFTNGLPAFDFQGRMPEPEENSEGFMSGALNNFPNLKSFGGFDALPDVPREDIVAPTKRTQVLPGLGRPSANRPSTSKKAKRDVTEKEIQLADDEAMLEPDELPSANATNSRTGRAPTDIADIIGDLVGSEQRVAPTFFPNQGPFGGRFGTPIHEPSQQFRRPPPPLIPPATISPPPVSSHRPQFYSQPLQPIGRSPHANQVDFIDDNSLLGSGNFEIVRGGLFRDSGANNYNSFFVPPRDNQLYSNRPAFNGGQPYVPPHGPSAQPPVRQPVTPAYQDQYQDPYQPTFFGGDDFFSNFRDFADVNNDYRN